MGISVALISLVSQDAGQTAVALPSLESVASAWQTLSSPSLLITIDCSRAGSKAGGGPAGASGFPFFFLGLGAMTGTKKKGEAPAPDLWTRRRDWGGGNKSWAQYTTKGELH